MDNQIISLLEENAHSFSKGQKRIARYLLADLPKAAFLTAAALAAETDVSESTVVRFAVELGYDGYPQMQKALQDAVLCRYRTGPRDERAQIQCSNEFAGVVQAISSARRIYLIASGPELAVAQYLGHHLEKRFADVHILCDSSAKLHHAGAEDVAVLFDFDGDTHKITQIAAACRNAGVKGVGIAGQVSSPLFQYCENTVFASCERAVFGYELSNAMILVETLLRALFVGEEKGDEV